MGFILLAQFLGYKVLIKWRHKKACKCRLL